MTKFSNKTRFYSKAVDGGPRNRFPSPPIALSALARRASSGEGVARD